MDISRLKEITDIVQSLATVLAFIAGGFWSYRLFVQRRQKYPRAEISHNVTNVRLTHDKILLNVIVNISNTGDVLLSLDSAETRIQQILPLPQEMQSAIDGHDPVKTDQTEFLWPLIGLRQSKWKKGELEFEPHESGQLRYDFILDSEVQTIKVYSFIRNITRRNREIGWALATTHDLRSRQ